MFPDNLALSRTTSHGILAPHQKKKKLMIHFQENAPTDGRMDRGTDPIL